MITIWILTIITFLLGYVLGRNLVTKDTYEEIKKEVSHRVLPQYRQASGVINRPTAQRINEFNNPKIMEEKEEMSKALENGIEPLTP